MKKFAALFFITLGLCAAGCSLINKKDVVQGNVISESDVAQLHRGMSESSVVAILGNPVFVNRFATNRMDYVYTFQKGHQSMTEKQVNLIFVNGRLQDIQQH
jgi:outer membrane protein assembly factor BamE